MILNNNVKTHCVDVEDHSEIRAFVVSSWTTPGKTILENKVMKKGTKLQALIDECGYYGPIMDILIRGVIPYVMILYFGENTNAITGKYLKEFLFGHFKEPEMRDVIENWFKNESNVRDFSTAYRNYRADHISSQHDALEY